MLSIAYRNLLGTIGKSGDLTDRLQALFGLLRRVHLYAAWELSLFLRA